MLTKLKPFMTRQEYVEANTERIPECGCWLWLGGLTTHGYGVAMRKPRMLMHRVSWEGYKGKIPEGLSVLHRCDVRCCVNPEHLYLGTQDDNMKDMARKGRSNNGRMRSR